MQKIFQNSVFIRALSAIYTWFGVQWRNSFFVNLFLKPFSGDGDNIFRKIWALFQRILYCILHALRIDKFSEGSIFRKPVIWFGLTIALAPLLPTKAVIALALVSYCSVLLCFGTERDRKPVYSRLNVLVILYSIVYTVSIFTSVTVSGSLSGGLLTVMFILYVFVAENSVSSKKQLDYILYAFVYSGVLVSVYGIYQYIFGISGADAWIDSEMFSDISVRVYSTLDNPNVLAEFLLLVMPFSFAFMITGKRLITKLFFGGCFCVMALCMVMTYSRGGWLGLLFCMALFLVLTDRRFIFVGIVGLIGLYFVLPDTIISRFTSIGNLTDTSTSYRLSIWLGSIAMLKDYWLTGIGPGTAAFNQIYPTYSYNSAAAQHSHNLFLQITCDAGICGIVLFMFIVILIFKNLSCAISSETDKNSKFLQIASMSGIAGFLVQSMTDYSFYNYRVMLIFWIMVGFSLLITRRTTMAEN